MDWTEFRALDLKGRDVIKHQGGRSFRGRIERFSWVVDDKLSIDAENGIAIEFYVKPGDEPQVLSNGNILIERDSMYPWSFEICKQ